MTAAVGQQQRGSNEVRPSNGHQSNNQSDNQSNHQSNNHQNGHHSTEFNQTVQLLFDQCNLVLETETGSKLRQLNSILTLYVLLMLTVKLAKRIKRTDLLTDDRVRRLNANLMNLMDQYSNGDEKTDDLELVQLALKLYLCILCSSEELNENELVDLLICDRLFDQLFRLIYKPRKQPLSHLALSLITLIQNKSHSVGGNLFTTRLSLLDNEIALNTYGQVISKQLLDFNSEFRKQESVANESGTMESIFSALTGLVLATNQQSKGEPSAFEQTLNSADHRASLLALFDIIQLNRNFIPFLLTNHSNQGEDKETDNLLINLLEFISINVISLREHFQSEPLQKKLSQTLRLAFAILTLIVEDQFSNSIMHDAASKFKVQIHRSKQRHRNLADANAKCINRPAAYSILDLMVEFLCSNLRKKHFQIDLYVFCNNIILKILFYQIKFEIRQEFNWVQLIQSLFILLRYLAANYAKSEELQVKRQSKMLLLANNVVNLFNLFIIFGDTFLHSPEQYDTLYYELLRENAIFASLAQLAKQAALSKKKDEKEAALKLANSLENVESIIGHFTSKINESKSEPPLSEEEIREIVRNNYDTLSIRVKDNLDFYEKSSQPDKQFKRKLLKRIIDQIKGQLNSLDELANEQQVVLQGILNC